MRTLMALFILGAGAAGYAYLQPASSLVLSETAPADSGSAVDTRLTSSAKVDPSRKSVKQLVSQIHEHTKSILDDFASQHGGHSDAPTENAFQRLKQVTKATESTQVDQPVPAPAAVSLKNSKRMPTSSLDDLERMAFDPAADVTIHSDEAADNLVDPLDPQSEKESSTPVRAVAGGADSTPLVSQRDPNKNSRKANIDPESSPAAVSTAKRPLSAEPSSQSVSEWKVAGKTTERRPMHTMHLGTEGTRTLVIAGLDGQDRIAVRWLEQLADSLAKQPELLENSEVLLFRAGNPDGLVRKTRDNSRGVPLNRNFPSRRYRPAPGMPKFAVPASEIETRVVLDSLYAFRPRRVIHLASTTGKSQVIYNRLAKTTATELERSSSMRMMPLDAEQVPGSIEDFSDGTLEAAVLTIRICVGPDWQQTWEKQQSQILSAVLGRPVDVEQKETDVQRDPDRTPLPLPLPNAEPISRRSGRRGYEELPAPPGGFVRPVQ